MQIPTDIFDNLRGLRRLKLIGSNIICDCDIFDKFSHWKSIGIDVDLTCHGPPKFNGKKIHNLNQRDLCSEFEALLTILKIIIIF